MGRAAKQKAAQRTARAKGIQLDELDYLRLARAQSKVDAALATGERSVRDAIAAADARLQVVKADALTVLDATAKKYGFDPRVNHRFDDDRCMLIPEDQS